MNDEALSEQKRASASVKLANTLIGIETLKPKIDVEHIPDLRRVEKQVDSSVSFEGTD
jgi:hypothetical protein